MILLANCCILLRASAGFCRRPILNRPRRHHKTWVRYYLKERGNYGAYNCLMRDLELHGIDKLRNKNGTWNIQELLSKVGPLISKNPYLYLHIAKITSQSRDQSQCSDWLFLTTCCTTSPFQFRLERLVVDLLLTRTTQTTCLQHLDTSRCCRQVGNKLDRRICCGLVVDKL